MSTSLSGSPLSVKKMSSVCISNCINDARDPRAPVRVTYVNLHKWPESEAEFVKSVRQGGQGHHPRVVDSISCRQLYLRSYPFTKEEPPEKTKCFGRIVKDDEERKRNSKKNEGKRKHMMLRKVKDSSCAALFRFFHRLLSCTTTVDVMDDKD